MVENHPRVLTIQNYLAEAYLRNGNLMAEIEGWKYLLKNHPLRREFLDRLLYACLKCKSIDDAKITLKDLEETFPGLELELIKVSKELKMTEFGSHNDRSNKACHA